MTAFDAHLGPRDADGSAWRGAAALLRARAGVLFATIVAAATIAGLAFVALAAGEAARWQVARAADGLQASVILRPQASRDAARLLETSLRALPFVREASLRTRESAMVALEKSGLPSGVNRVNPLPDVWIVTLAFGDGESSLADRVAGARRAFAALPDVESVDVDPDWLATLDRWRSSTATAVRVTGVLVFAIAGLLLACLYFVAGRALGAASPTAAREEGSSGAARAIVGFLVGSATLAVAAALVAACGSAAQSSGLDWKPIVVRMGQTSSVAMVVLAFGTLLLAIGLTWAAGRSDRRDRSFPTSRQA